MDIQIIETKNYISEFEASITNLENIEKAMEDEQHLLDDNHDDQVQIMTNGTMVGFERESFL